ncbi:MAG: flagellin [Verrucomicrobiota bacterium]|nr:flagellin [Verrucomicrobiota bacterium]
MIIADTNSFASRLSRDLSSTQSEREKHTRELSSGLKINGSVDDVGAISTQAVHRSELNRLRRVGETLQNGLSYTNSQQAALSIVQKIYGRMSTLATMAMDITKNDQDRLKYDNEFQELREQVLEIDLERFNDQDLFRNTKYEVINTGSINWINARAHVAAANLNDPNYDHYLATITSSEEQDEINRQLKDSVAGTQMWLGGSDSEFNGETPGSNEGNWRWVEGPEGLEDGGKGKLFWQGKGEDTGGTLVPGMYENWNRRPGANNDEPNQFFGVNEDGLQITTQEKWNDLHLFNNGPTAYLRESDPSDLNMQRDPHGDSFELQRINFKRFLPSTNIDLKSIANAQDALSRVMAAEDDVSDKLALVGSNASRIASEFEAIQSQVVEKEKTLSRIEDLDVAAAATSLARAEIRMQATTFVFTQANKLFNQRNYVEELLN